jgi:NADPH:quinone reductase-like Zn-dependent oxidoreductase
VKLLAPAGVYVSSVGRLGWVLKVAVASLSARGRGKIVSLTAHQTQQDLAVLKEMLESGKVKPVIDRQYTLAEVQRLSSIRDKDTRREGSSSLSEERDHARMSRVHGSVGFWARS